MAEPVNGYLTTTEALRYVGQNDTRDTQDLADTITAVSRFIDEYCGRHFYQDGTVETPVARSFEPSCATELELGPYNDLVSITSLKFDSAGDGTYEQTVTGYQLEPYNPRGKPYTKVCLLGSEVFPVPIFGARRNVVQITGVWGWAAVPAEVKAACRILVAEVNKLADAPLGIAGGGDFGVAYVGRRLPARAADLLAPYRHPGNFGIA